ASDPLTSHGRSRRSTPSTVYRHKTSSGADSKRPPHNVIVARTSDSRLLASCAGGSFSLAQQPSAELAEPQRVEPDEPGGVRLRVHGVLFARGGGPGARGV